MWKSVETATCARMTAAIFQARQPQTINSHKNQQSQQAHQR